MNEWNYNKLYFQINWIIIQTTHNPKVHLSTCDLPSISLTKHPQSPCNKVGDHTIGRAKTCKETATELHEKPI